MPPKKPPCFSLLPCLLKKGITFQRGLVLGITFLAYASLHASRKAPSIVKSVLGPQNEPDPPELLALPQAGWAPFDGSQGTHRLGELDVAFLGFYALGMFLSGHLADRMDVRLFLCCGMLLSGVFTVAFGCGYWFNVHQLWYFVVVQCVCGFVQSSGWPSVVSVVGNWFGKSQKKGLIMGVWNSNTSVGNIIGSLVASFMLRYGWGWSFFWPGLFVILAGVAVFLLLAVSPEVVGLSGDEIELNRSGEDISADVAEAEASENSSLLQSENAEGPKGVEESDESAIGFIAAWRLPGVASFAICLFFSKFVAYTFLYWLPFYISHTAVAGKHLSHETAGMLSTVFDVGGVLGGVLAGLISDRLGGRAITSASFLVFSIPALFLYRVYGSSSMFANIVLMLLSGSLVNGPYALITTAVAADLGTQSAVSGNSRALATVTAIIDGTGSIGAAIGPLIVGYMSTGGWTRVFEMLSASTFIAALSLIPAVMSEITGSQTNGAAQ